jgi:predicted nucleic acid-binding protein
MNAFLDTSVLVATFYGDHEHHAASLELFLRFDKRDVSCGAHSLAEVYASLTGMPGHRRVSGHEALLFLGDVRDRMTIVALEEGDYFQILESSAEVDLAGGAIYDAILGHCALKAKAEVIYTWNTRDFLRLPAAIAGRVKTPEANAD